MLTLGISDTASTAALIDNGKILSIIHEERMQRIKRFVGFPKESILECLRIADISKEEINNIAIVNTNEFPIKLRTDIFEHKNLPYNIFSSRYERFLTMVFEFYRLKILNNKNINKVDSFISKKIVERKLRNLGFKDQKKYYIDHHLAHASSAFYTSNFGESLVITLDGQGNRISGTVVSVEDEDGESDNDGPTVEGKSLLAGTDSDEEDEEWKAKNPAEMGYQPLGDE